MYLKINGISFKNNLPLENMPESSYKFRMVDLLGELFSYKKRLYNTMIDNLGYVLLQLKEYCDETSLHGLKYITEVREAEKMVLF